MRTSININTKKLLLTALLSLSTILASSCIYPVYDEKTAATVEEQQSVWQYLKIYSIYERLPDRPGSMTPYDMFSVINDSLGSGRYTEYVDDRPGGGVFFTPELIFDDTLELTPSTAYIRIPEFSIPARDFFRASRNFMMRYQNIIIDLRFNGGGYLSVSNDMLGELLPYGTGYIKICQRNYSEQKLSGETLVDTLKTSNTYPNLLGKNIVVLMNGNSASASEIMIAALKDRANAYLVGETSYGKGIGQVIIERNRRKTLSITSLTLDGLTERTRGYHKVGIAADTIPEEMVEEVMDEITELLLSQGSGTAPHPLFYIAIAQSMDVLEEACGGDCSYMSPGGYLEWIIVLSTEMLCAVKLLDPEFMVLPGDGDGGDDGDGSDGNNMIDVAAADGLRKLATRKGMALSSKEEMRDIIKNGMTTKAAIPMRRLPMGAVIVSEEELLKKYPQLLRLDD